MTDEAILKHIEAWLEDEIKHYASTDNPLKLENNYDHLNYGRYEIATILRDKISKLRKDERFA